MLEGGKARNINEGKPNLDPSPTQNYMDLASTHMLLVIQSTDRIVNIGCNYILM